MDTEVAYEPASVKELLAEMKDTAALLVDLSFSAVLLGDEDVAAEVLVLEDRMDVLQLRARMSVMMAARSPDDAEALAPVLSVVEAAEKISDAAGDIAKVVVEDIGLPPAMRTALPEAVETVVRAELAADSRFADRTLGDVNLETDTGVRVIAIRRGGDWLANPDAETTLSPGDVLLLRGPDDSVYAVAETASGVAHGPPTHEEPTLPDLERAVDSIVHMKNTSELAVDLAYGAALFDSVGLAEEVEALETEVDALESRFEAWVLKAAADVEDPVSLRGLVHLARASEVISDAAAEISEGVFRGLGTHPVVAEAVLESDEVLVRESVRPGSALDGTTLGAVALSTKTGMRAVAVRRPRDGGDDWEISPGPESELAAGDVVMAKGTRSGAERFAALAGGD